MTSSSLVSSPAMSLPEIEFRVARSDDAAGFAVFAERVFRAAFGSYNTVADMDSYCAGAFGVARQRAEIADPARHTELVFADGELAAYFQLRSEPPPAFVTGAAPIEILRFYVDPRWHGRGVAQAMMDHVIALARGRGAGALYLSVWDRNDRAIAFYARYGFAQVGNKQFLLGTDLQVDNVMTRAIS
jgi:ribosomal protein S18 acetylase RimI-like enzyme